MFASNVHTEAGPTATLIGVEVLEVGHNFCGGSSVNMAVGGINSGDCGSFGAEDMVNVRVTDGAAE